MRFKTTMTVFAFVLVAALVLGTRPASVSAQSGRNGQLHITKNCSADNGNPGDYCTITSSNLSVIPGSSNSAHPAKVFYDQAGGIPNPLPITMPLGMLDSNVVLYVGTGDWAVSRCTLDVNNMGLCTFSDGTGQLTGFNARVTVRPFSSSPSEVDFYWDGTYSFNPLPDK
jgi:hypothetical protein